MITSDQLKKEKREFYHLGYKMGYLNLTIFLKTIIPKEEFYIYSQKIKDHYENYPIMDKLKEMDLI